MVSDNLPLVATNAAKIFYALGDPTRRQLFELLLKRPSAVVDLAERLPVSRPAVSQHLKVLSDAGLVVARQKGTRRFYQVDPTAMQVMREYLDRVWDQALVSFKTFAEIEEGE